jgi:hypothetical protein
MNRFSKRKKNCATEITLQAGISDGRGTYLRFEEVVIEMTCPLFPDRTPNSVAQP